MHDKQKDLFKDAINRSYYVAFYAVKAVFDYDDFYIASQEEAREQIQAAEKILSGIKAYLQEKEIAG